ncbi:MAG: amidase family protein, partial [Thermomicrobiales bacterium]
VDTIWATAMAAINRDDLDEVRDQIDQGRLAVVESGRGRSGLDLAAAFIARNDYYHGWREFMSRYDLVLTPTLPCTAFPVGLDQPGSVAGRATTYLSWTGFTYPFNATGQPAATVPCGFDASGLPIGLQIVGRWRADSTVLRAAAAYEAMVPWAAARPPV